jgi:hypothetical protein
VCPTKSAPFGKFDHQIQEIPDHRIVWNEHVLVLLNLIYIPADVLHRVFGDGKGMRCTFSSFVVVFSVVEEKNKKILEPPMREKERVI